MQSVAAMAGEVRRREEVKERAEMSAERRFMAQSLSLFTEAARAMRCFWKEDVAVGVKAEEEWMANEAMRRSNARTDDMERETSVD
mmetsp:Transcript_7925/g.11821  ORF Transcript_7925/g.11821 Transcript_7925/m.11821 type:complete len:86 (+) Transcript_7925:471-728(+)